MMAVYSSGFYAWCSEPESQRPRKREESRTKSAANGTEGPIQSVTLACSCALLSEYAWVM